jgi:hypothetical protein
MTTTADIKRIVRQAHTTRVLSQKHDEKLFDIISSISFSRHFAPDVLVSFERSKLTRVSDALDAHELGYDICTIISDGLIAHEDRGGEQITLIISPKAGA